MRQLYLHNKQYNGDVVGVGATIKHLRHVLMVAPAWSVEFHYLICWRDDVTRVNAK